MTDSANWDRSEIGRLMQSLHHTYPKVCTICGADFVGKTKSARYCSPRCEWTASNHRRRDRQQAAKQA